MIEIIRMRCDSKAAFDAWMAAKGLNVAGVDVIVIDQITQKPAVLDKDGNVVTAAIIDTAFHVDLRIVSINGYEKDAWERRYRLAPISMVDDPFETLIKGLAETDAQGVQKSLFDRTTLGSDLKKGTQVTTRKNGVTVAPGYKDVTAGVAIIEPATPRHVWC